MELTKRQREVKMQLLEAEMILTKGGTQKEIRDKFGDTLGQIMPNEPARIWTHMRLSRKRNSRISSEIAASR